VLARGSRTRGVISWFGPAGETAASVSYEADMTNAGEGRLRLRFSTLDPRSGDRRQVDQRVALAATRPGFGGERYWFADDGRRAGRPQLTPGGDRFKSRRTCARAADQRLLSGRSGQGQTSALTISVANDPYATFDFSIELHSMKFELSAP
jgi:hypothetical protein